MADGIYALAEPGSAVSALDLNNEFNLFGKKTYIVGRTYTSFPMIDDAPLEMAVVKESEGSWWGNLITGVVVTVALAALAVVTVATGGAALAVVCLAGAAIGTGVVTASVAVTDHESGNARSWGDFVGCLIVGGAIGAIAGASIYGLWVAAPIVGEAAGIQASLWLGAVSPLTYSIIPTIVTLGGYGLAGLQTTRFLNEIASIGSGQNWMLDQIFGGDQDNYDTATMLIDMFTMGYMYTASNNAGLAETKEDNNQPPPETENPKEVNIHGAINSELDEVDLDKKIIYEDKNASKLYMDKPDYPQTEAEWAESQIFKKGKNRIEALQQPEFSLSSKESTALPSVEELREVKDFIFRIDADTPELRSAVQDRLNRLTEMFPSYTFSAEYGGG